MFLFYSISLPQCLPSSQKEIIFQCIGKNKMYGGDQDSSTPPAMRISNGIVPRRKCYFSTTHIEPHRGSPGKKIDVNQVCFSFFIFHFAFCIIFYKYIFTYIQNWYFLLSWGLAKDNAKYKRKMQNKLTSSVCYFFTSQLRFATICEQDGLHAEILVNYLITNRFQREAHFW